LTKVLYAFLKPSCFQTPITRRSVTVRKRYMSSSRVDVACLRIYRIARTGRNSDVVCRKPNIQRKMYPSLVVRDDLKPMHRCGCTGPRASGSPGPWWLGRLFIFARYSLRTRIAERLI